MTEELKALDNLKRRGILNYVGEQPVDLSQQLIFFG